MTKHNTVGCILCNPQRLRGYPSVEEVRLVNGYLKEYGSIHQLARSSEQVATAAQIQQLRRDRIDHDIALWFIKPLDCPRCWRSRLDQKVRRCASCGLPAGQFEKKEMAV